MRALPLMKHVSVHATWTQGFPIVSKNREARTQPRPHPPAFVINDFVGVAKEMTLAKVPINSIAINRHSRLFLSNERRKIVYGRVRFIGEFSCN